MTECQDHRPLGAGVIADSGGRQGPMSPRGLWFRGGPRGTAQTTGAFVWLAFILFPAVNAFAKRGTALHHALTIAGALVFVVTYIALVSIWRWRYADRALPILFGLLVVVAIGLTLSDGTSWGFLFTYCAACAGLISRRFGFAAVVACSVLAGVTSALGGASGGQVISWVASSAGIGMLILVMRDLRLRNEELSEARGELARMAVAEERERFARDLHDLLGHSLSVIALKAELAGRMLMDRPTGAAPEAGVLDRAATEVRELEQVARTALGEVREAVSGYRQPTLAGELAGARMALAAAGIEADVQEAHVPLDPAVEAVLAWTVREGATNVIRHSGARHCTLRITTSLSDAGVEVIDDGVGDSARASGAGAARVSRAEAGHASRAEGPLVSRAEAARVSRAEAGHASRAGAAHAARAGTPGHDSSVNGGAQSDRTAVRHDAATANGISGHGLAGLAERARLLNGMVEAGPRAGGGYRLAVTIPAPRA
ncbi:MAG: hypothetical protein JO046_15235 [Solirubrobacterales bacterium]|nr:hypothetical protein [Solirubrobacterales bacterium]